MNLTQDEYCEEVVDYEAEEVNFDGTHPNLPEGSYTVRGLPIICRKPAVEPKPAIGPRCKNHNLLHLYEATK